MNLTKKERLELLIEVLKTPNLDDLLKIEINNEIRKILFKEGE